MKIEELKKPLSRDAVRTRSKGNFDLSYIEGWWAIAEANRIFGFDGWTRETLYCKEVCRYEIRDKHKVGYEAHVQITARAPDNSHWVIREGTGHGSGIALDLFDAIEGAAKEAETDAMKRALMTFGNPFGLALYDKDQKNVQSSRVADAIEFFRELIDEDDIEANHERFKRAAGHLSQQEQMAVVGGLKPLKAGRKSYASIFNEYMKYHPADNQHFEDVPQ